MTKLFLLFLLSAYSTFSIYATAASITLKVQGGADNIDTIESESRLDDGAELKERSLVAGALRQVQKKSDASSSELGAGQQLATPKKQGDFGANAFNGKAAETENLLYSDPFAETETSPYIFKQASSDHQTGFNPLLVSKEFIISLEIIDDELVIDEALREMVDDTVTMALHVNEAWNTLDEKITHKVYQGVSYLGFDNQFSEDNYQANNQAVEFKKLAAQYADSEIKNRRYVNEPEGFFAYLINLPRLLTVSNLLFMLGFLFVMNGIYRVMRFFLLRI
ncbi:MAG: hypothetical protein KJ725_11860 [Gammaproteobacteria bacterium]|uniref:hypothetical protein n=1 Tax=Methylotuvimicrobium sp. TaxID=2822413 RepID=UPI001E105AC6|nr:hypothetical protein [Gammaproteobacteria bacterium]